MNCRFFYLNYSNHNQAMVKKKEKQQYKIKPIYMGLIFKGLDWTDPMWLKYPIPQSFLATANLRYDFFLDGIVSQTNSLYE